MNLNIRSCTIVNSVLKRYSRTGMNFTQPLSA